MGFDTDSAVCYFASRIKVWGYRRFYVDGTTLTLFSRSQFLGAKNAALGSSAGPTTFVAKK